MSRVICLIFITPARLVIAGGQDFPVRAEGDGRTTGGACSFQGAEELELRFRLIRHDRRNTSKSEEHPDGSHDRIPRQENSVTNLLLTECNPYANRDRGGKERSHCSEQE